MIVNTRCGCSMAITWAIIPPSDSPRTWAASISCIIEDRNGVGGHVRQHVALASRASRRVSEMGRQADIAIVEAQHPQPVIDEPLAPRLIEGDALATAPVDHHQRRVVRRTERLVVQLDLAMTCYGHATPYPRGWVPADSG